MSILSRKRDLLYLIFFVIHIVVIICVDAYPLYPDSLRPQFMRDLRKYYIDTYHDQFFIAPPAWFRLFMWMEVIYHIPLSVWAVGALLRDDPRVPVQLLIYAVQTAVTTAACVADYLSWSGFSNSEKVELGKLYVPYLVLSVFMGLDMWQRLDTLVGARRLSAQKKRI